jgi:hypothetical protein
MRPETPLDGTRAHKAQELPPSGLPPAACIAAEIWTGIAALSLLAFLPISAPSSFSRVHSSSRPSMDARMPRQSGNAPHVQRKTQSLRARRTPRLQPRLPNVAGFEQCDDS